MSISVFGSFRPKRFESFAVNELSEGFDVGVIGSNGGGRVGSGGTTIGGIVTGGGGTNGGNEVNPRKPFAGGEGVALVAGPKS